MSIDDWMEQMLFEQKLLESERLNGETDNELFPITIDSDEVNGMTFDVEIYIKD